MSQNGQSNSFAYAENRVNTQYSYRDRPAGQVTTYFPVSQDLKNRVNDAKDSLTSGRYGFNRTAGDKEISTSYRYNRYDVRASADGSGSPGRYSTFDTRAAADGSGSPGRYNTYDTRASADGSGSPGRYSTFDTRASADGSGSPGRYSTYNTRASADGSGSPGRYSTYNTRASADGSGSPGRYNTYTTRASADGSGSPGRYSTFDTRASRDGSGSPGRYNTFDTRASADGSGSPGRYSTFDTRASADGSGSPGRYSTFDTRAAADGSGSPGRYDTYTKRNTNGYSYVRNSSQGQSVKDLLEDSFDLSGEEGTRVNQNSPSDNEGLSPSSILGQDLSNYIQRNNPGLYAEMEEDTLFTIDFNEKYNRLKNNLDIRTTNSVIPVDNTIAGRFADSAANTDERTEMTTLVGIMKSTMGSNEKINEIIDNDLKILWADGIEQNAGGLFDTNGYMIISRNEPEFAYDEILSHELGHAFDTWGDGLNATEDDFGPEWGGIRDTAKRDIIDSKFNMPGLRSEYLQYSATSNDFEFFAVMNDFYINSPLALERNLPDVYNVFNNHYEDSVGDNSTFFAWQDVNANDSLSNLNYLT